MLFGRWNGPVSERGLFGNVATGESVRRVTDFGSSPAWSRGGESIDYRTNAGGRRGIGVVFYAAGQEVPVTLARPPAGRVLFLPPQDGSAFPATGRFDEPLARRVRRRVRQGVVAHCDSPGGFGRLASVGSRRA